MEAYAEEPKIVEADFAAHRREIAIQNSPFGPIQKYGESILKHSGEAPDDITDGTAPEPQAAAEPLGRYAYRRFEGSQLSWAIERTDLSDPQQPFQDF